MSADVDNNLQGFRLALDPLTYRAWEIRRMYLGATALIALAALKRGVDHRSPSAIDKEALLNIGRRLSHVVAGHGLLRPVVLVITLGPTSIGPDGAASPTDEPFLTDLARWSKDQDWHRGDFLLYVYASDADRDRLLTDLLSDLPVVFVSPDRILDSSLSKALMECAGLKDNNLLQEIVAAIDHDIKATPKDGPAFQRALGSGVTARQDSASNALSKWAQSATDRARARANQREEPSVP